MFGKIQFIAFLGFTLISCQDNVITTHASQKLANEIEAIGNTYNYSDTDWDKVNVLFKKQAYTDIQSTLAYYNFASHYYSNKKDYKKAMVYADSMLSLVNKPGYENTFFKQRAIADIAKADVFYAMKHYNDSYFYYCNGSIEAGKTHDSSLTEILYTRLSMFLYEEGNYSKAIYYYKQLLKDVTGANKTYGRLISNQGVQDNIGVTFLREKKGDSAVAYFNAALQSIGQATLLKKEEPFCRMASGVVY